MTTIVNDTFTNADGTTLVLHGATEIGGPWTRGGSMSGVVSILSNKLYSSATPGGSYFSASVASADGEYVEAAFEFKSLAGNIGIGCRGIVGSVKGYFVAYISGVGWRVYRQDGFSVLTVLATSASHVPVAGSTYTVRLTTTGTGATVALAVTIDGVNQAGLAYNDSSASRLTALGSAMIYADGAVTSTTGIHLLGIVLVDPAVVASMVFDAPARRVYRHSATTWSAAATGAFTSTGAYSTTAPDQIRIVRDGTNTPITGFDWTSIGSATGGVWSHTFTGVPQGEGTGWYNVQLRNSAAPATIYSSGKMGVGVHIANIGQSQSTNQALVGDSTLTPTGMAVVHGRVGTWLALNTSSMNALIAADQVLSPLLGGNVPVAFLDLGYPGTGLVAGGAGQWLPTASSAYYQYAKNTIAALEGKVDAVVDIRGESDANAGTVSQASFKAGLDTLFTALRADLGNANLPIVIAIMGNTTYYWTDANGEAIRAAQAQKAAEANTYRVETYDQPLGGDNLHRSVTGVTNVGKRWALAVAYALGRATGYRSPRFSNVRQISSTVYDLPITLDGGTDIAPISPTAVTGIRVIDSVTLGAITPASVLRTSPSNVRVTLSSAPANMPAIGSAYGRLASTNLFDNSSPVRPIEYTAPIVAVPYTAATLSFVLRDGSGAPLASTSVRAAWFDQPAVNNVAAPTDVTTVSTDGSGVFSWSLTNTALAASGTGTLAISTSAGTAGVESRGAVLPIKLDAQPVGINLLNQLGSNGAGAAGAGFSRLQGGH